MRFVNEAVWDRIVRVVIGAVLLYLGWAGVVGGGFGTFLKFFGLIPLATVWWAAVRYTPSSGSGPMLPGARWLKPIDDVPAQATGPALWDLSPCLMPSP